MSRQWSSIFTTATHSGEAPTMGGAQPHVAPIVSSVGFAFDTVADAASTLGGGSRNFVYARNAGPTQVAFEDAVAALEGAPAALSFASGMAALHAALLTVAHNGGHVVAAEVLYGTTRSLLQWMDANTNISLHMVDMFDLDASRAIIAQVEPTAVICEVISNPTARVTDLPAIVEMTHTVGGQVVVDNTFATPYLLRPLELGADLVVHSATKFLNGHGDVLAGVLAGPADLCHVAFGQRTLMGTNLGAFEAWLALRGLRTLPLRMRQACSNAAQIANWLKQQAGVSRVMYPGDPDHPDHHTATRLFGTGEFGAMMAFELADADQATAFAFIDALKLCESITSLGALTTMISHPATASHRGWSEAERMAHGISQGLVRLSVGVEEAADIIADLDQALAAV